MNANSSRMIRGISLSLTAAILWGLLPIGLSIVRGGLDPYTTTWYRFVSAGATLLIFLTATNRLPALGSLQRKVWWLLAAAVIGLLGNYITYVVALPYITPTFAPVVMQLGPMLLLLSGPVLCGERLSRMQWVGFGVLIAGLFLFFNDRLPEVFAAQSRLGVGVALLTVSTILWAVYGLSQKYLLQWMPSQNILMLLYCSAAVLLWPWAAPLSIRQMNTVQAGALIFCCLNTIVAYGAFAEALKEWEASRVGAVLATSPLFTMASMWCLRQWAPGMIAPEHLNRLSVAGTFLVVLGSGACALLRYTPQFEMALPVPSDIAPIDDAERSM